MFSTEFLMQLLVKAKNNIMLPESSFFVLNDNNLRLCFYVVGWKKPFYIIIPSKLAAANYLKDNGIVDSFGVVNGDIVLYRHSFYYDFDHNDKPVMLMVPKPYEWSKVKLTKSDVLNLAGKRELERCIEGIPIEKAATMYTPAKYNY